MLERIVHPRTAETRIIRLPAAGPEPANTLVHLHCRIPGVKERGLYGSDSRFELEFETAYVIAGYDQRFHDWYVENTQISATAMFRKLDATTDFIFTIALDEVRPFISFKTGAIGFVVTQASIVDDEAWFPESNNEFVMGGSVSAWILAWEPPVQRPPSGVQRSQWIVGSVESVVKPKRSRLIETAAGSESRITPKQPPGRRSDPC
jgi:hypothetical protein